MGELEVSQAQQVLRRAVQLDRQRRQRAVGLHPSALEEAAAEIGVEPVAVAIALAEVRAGVSEGPRGLLDRLVGPAAVAAAREVNATEEEVAALLADWLERGHHLRVHERADGVLVAQRRTDLAASVGRTLRRSIEGEGALGAIRELQGGVGSAGDGVAVCLRADVGDKRAGSLAGGVTVAALGLAGTGVAAIAATPVLLVASPVALAAGWAVARRGHRSTITKVEGDLARTVEAVAKGTPPRSIMSGLGRAMGRSRRLPR